MEKDGSKAAMEKESTKAPSASSAALGVLHAEKSEAEASAWEPEQLLKEPQVEDLEEGGAQGVVAAADLEKADAEAVVVEEGGAGAPASVLADNLDQNAKAEDGVAVRWPADASKVKEDVVLPEAQLEDPYTAWVAGGKKRKFEEMGEPVYPSDSDGSLEYDSTDSSESVDKRNVGSFKRKLLEQLRGGSLRYLKSGRYSCPWHTRKPKCGSKNNLKQHARELCRTGTSVRIRAQHEVLWVVLAENAQE